MNNREIIQAKVRALFIQYLKACHMQQTRERFAILEAIYDINGFFNIEDLKSKLEAKNFNVSTGTLYKTTALLVEANLLIRHPFSTSTAIFEQIADDKPRCYQVCNGCHKITRIAGKELAAVVGAYRPRSFVPTHRVMYVYGLCSKCEKKIRRTRQTFLEL